MRVGVDECYKSGFVSLILNITSQKQYKHGITDQYLSAADRRWWAGVVGVCTPLLVVLHLSYTLITLQILLVEQYGQNSCNSPCMSITVLICIAALVTNHSYSLPDQRNCSILTFIFKTDGNWPSHRTSH